MRIRVGVLAGAFLSLTLAAASTLVAQGAATSVCKDGTTSATTGRGACSGHGGVDTKATDAAKKATDKADKGATKAASSAAKTTDKADKAASATAKGTDKAAKATDKAVDKSVSQASKADAAVAKTASKTESKVDKAADKAAASKPKTTGADNNDPTNATAQCKDGTYSHAKNHQGACSNHGGVAKFLK